MNGDDQQQKYAEMFPKEYAQQLEDFRNGKGPVNEFGKPEYFKRLFEEFMAQQ